MNSQSLKSKIAAHLITRVFALGGLNEIGKNTYCVEHDHELIIIDAGIKFANKKLSDAGIEAIIPNYQYLLTNVHKLKALFITHGHEDHIGGIVHLLKQVELPVIYAPQLAAALIRERLKEHNMLGQTHVKEYDAKSLVTTRYFKVNFFPVNHSIPDSFGISIMTPNGRIVTTGDYKFDWTSIGQEDNLAILSQYGQEGIKLLLADSTNSEVPGYTVSESKIIANLELLFQTTQSRIFFSTFASNVHRIRKVLNLAAKYHRKVLVIGRSLDKITNIIKNLGHLQMQDDVFVNTAEELQALPAKNALIVCTGSQGEPNAALSRIASGRHNSLKISRNDLVILASSAIPGNKLGVEKLVNELVKRGAQVKENRPEFLIHTSGHAAIEDQKLMFMLTRPEFFMPMHGDFRMLKKHGETAVSVNVKPENVFLCANGDQLNIHQDRAWIGEHVNAEPVYIDTSGQVFNHHTSQVINQRSALAQHGLLSVVLTFDRNRTNLISAPKIISRGSFFVQKSGKLIHELIRLSVELVEQFLAQKTADFNRLTTMLSERLGAYVFRVKKRRPVIIPIFMNE